MSLGLYEGRNRRRRQFWWSVAKWCLAIAFILAAGVYSYYGGRDLAQREVVRLESDIESLRAEIAAFDEQRADLQDQIRLAVTRAKEWESQYKRDVPTGEMRAILKLIEEKLQRGDVSAERLAFLVKSAAEPRDCEEDPETKRFIVRTNLQAGANDSVSFDSKTVTVTAVGEAAVNSNGQTEAWFDADKPLTVTFTRVGGEKSEATGPLPLHHSMVGGGKEYRFTVTPGQRGFVNVTAAVCAYP